MTIVDWSTQAPVESGARFTLLQAVHFVARVLHSLHADPHGVQVAGDPLEKVPGGHLLRHWVMFTWVVLLVRVFVDVIYKEKPAEQVRALNVPVWASNSQVSTPQGHILQTLSLSNYPRGQVSTQAPVSSHTLGETHWEHISAPFLSVSQFRHPAEQGVQLATIRVLPWSHWGINEAVVNGSKVFLLLAGQSRLHFPVEFIMNCLSWEGPAMQRAQIVASGGVAIMHPGVKAFGVQRLFSLLRANP